MRSGVDEDEPDNMALLSIRKSGMYNNEPEKTRVCLILRIDKSAKNNLPKHTIHVWIPSRSRAIRGDDCSPYLAGESRF